MNAAIVWRGLSRFDHATPIVVLLTGLRQASRNRKTGPAVQAYVLVEGVLPVDAAWSGVDAAICGDCPRRQTESEAISCYVSMYRGMSRLGHKLVRGGYPELRIDEISRFLAGRLLRVGAYGDPAAVPVEVWMSLIGRAQGWTAYTHQWRRAPELKPIAMASVDSIAEARLAKALGWRTFRVRAPDNDPVVQGEIVCPASIEAGKRTTCNECRLCAGLASFGRDIAIIDHSTKALWSRGLGPRKRRLPLVSKGTH